MPRRKKNKIFRISKKNKKAPEIKFLAAASFLSVVVFFVIVHIYSNFVKAWSEPVAVPPASDVGPLINASSNSQYKEGRLCFGNNANPSYVADVGCLNSSLQGLSTSGMGYLNSSSAALGLIVQNGNVGIGTLTPQEKFVLDGGNFLQTGRDPKHISFSNTSFQIPSNIYISNNYAYITSPAGAGNGGLEIRDISSKITSTLISQMNDFSCQMHAPRCVDFFLDVFIAGHYAYVVGSGVNDSGIQIFDISNPAGPLPKGALFDDEASCSGCALKVPIKIQIVGKYAYILSGITGEKGLEIVDISNPSKPVHVSAITDSLCDNGTPGRCLLNNPKSLFVSGKYAYIVNANISGNDDSGLEIIDISNPAIPVHVGKITNTDCDAGTIPLNSCALDNANDIYISGRYAYIAGYGDKGLEILDISNPFAPSHTGSIFDSDTQCASNKCALATPLRIKVYGKYAYITSKEVYDSKNEDGLEIVDISNPIFPIHAGKITNNICDTANLPNGCALENPTGIFISGKYAYVTSYNENGLEIIDISGIDSPSANIGNIAANYISVSDNMDIGNNLYVKTSLNVGGGIMSDSYVQGSDFMALSSIRLTPIKYKNAATCNAAAEGTIYIEDAAPYKLCYCKQGTGWVYFDGSSACAY